MSPAQPSEDEVPQVSAMVDLLRDALIHAKTIKPAATVEPPLTKSHFDAFIARLPTIFPGAASSSVSHSRDSDKVRLYATVETAARKIFSSMVVSGPYSAISELPLNEKLVGEHIDRYSRVCPSLESLRLSLRSIRQRTMRPCPSFLACGRTARQPNCGRLPQGLRLSRI